MSTARPTFRIMKNGYDRFAVDDTVERYVEQVESLQKKLAVYEKQLEETSDCLNELKSQYDHLENSMNSQKEAAENIARLSLREANEIITTAKRNADEIIHQALITARLILTDLSKIYESAGSVKASTKAQMEGLIEELDNFKLPQMPDLRWLQEAEEKMRG